MAEADDEAEPKKPGWTHFVTFSPTVSVGTLVVLLGMVGTASLFVFGVGAQVRGVQDAIAHETEIRVSSEVNQAQKMADLQAQQGRDVLRLQKENGDAMLSMQSREASDVSMINQSLTEMRADVRTLIQSSGRDGKH